MYGWGRILQLLDDLNLEICRFPSWFRGAGRGMPGRFWRRWAVQRRGGWWECRRWGPEVTVANHLAKEGSSGILNWGMPEWVMGVDVSICISYRDIYSLVCGHSLLFQWLQRVCLWEGSVKVQTVLSYEKKPGLLLCCLFHDHSELVRNRGYQIFKICWLFIFFSDFDVIGVERGQVDSSASVVSAVGSFCCILIGFTLLKLMDICPALWTQTHPSPNITTNPTTTLSMMMKTLFPWGF